MDLTREVLLSPEAEAELIAILEYIAERNPLAAGAMSAKFDDLFRRLAIAPKSRAVCEGDERVRRRALGNYVIYYRFDEVNDRILIVAIIHGARIHHRMRDA